MFLPSTLIIIAAAFITMMISVGTVDSDSHSSSKYKISRQSYTENGICVSNIQIEGNGVSDSFEVSCFEESYFFQKDDILVYCIPPVDSFCLYCNQPSTLVVLVTKKCTKRTYDKADNTVHISSASMSDDTCNDVIKQIKSILKKHNIGSSSSSQSGESTYENVSENSMLDLSSILKTSAKTKQMSTHVDIKTKTISEDGECKRVIETKGNGITDKFSVECADNSDKILQVKGTVVVGKPQDSFLLFSNTASTLVVISDGTCTKKIYSDNDSHPDSTSMSEDECAAVLEEIAALYSGTSSDSSSSDWL